MKTIIFIATVLTFLISVGSFLVSNQNGDVENNIGLQEKSDRSNETTQSPSITSKETQNQDELLERLNLTTSEQEFFSTLWNFAKDFDQLPDDDASKIMALEVLIEIFTERDTEFSSSQEYVLKAIKENHFLSTELSSYSRELLESLIGNEANFPSLEELYLLGAYSIDGFSSIAEDLLIPRFTTSEYRLQPGVTNIFDIHGKAQISLEMLAVNGSDEAASSLVQLYNGTPSIYKKIIFEDLKYLDNPRILEYLVQNLYSSDVIEEEADNMNLLEPASWYAAKALAWKYRYPFSDFYRYGTSSSQEINGFKGWIEQNFPEIVSK